MPRLLASALVLVLLIGSLQQFYRFPPLLLQVGDAELFLEQVERLGRRAAAAGVDVTVEVWPGMIHVWHVFAGRVPESTAGVERVGAFLRAALT